MSLPPVPRSSHALLVLVACASPREPVVPPPDPATLSLAVWAGDDTRVRDLLARGADPDGADADERTPWQWAMTARDRAMTERLLAHAPRLADRQSTRLALRTAAARDDAWLVDALLTRGVSVDGERDERASALLVAAENGARGAMVRLLAAGAVATRADPGGDTPLAAAVRSGCTACVELLLSHGADAAHVDRAGRSALAWARRTAQPELAARLVRAGAPDEAAPGWAAAATNAAAVARAIPLLQQANARWQGDGECTACHHLPMALRTIALAERHGVAIDRALARDAVRAVRDDDARFAALARGAIASADGVLRLGMATGGDPAFGNAWFLAAELDAGLPADGPQLTLATLLARMQQPDGRWRSGPLRGAIEWSDVEATALAVRVIAGYGDGAARGVLPAAERWLAGATPTSIVDRAFLLWVARDPAPGVAALRALQHADGSWSHADGPGDAYSTGLVAVVLLEAGGVDAADPAIARAADYLRQTQEADGSWLVPSRAPPLLPMHDHGFPHGRLQFVSYAGTAWATMALLHTLTASPR